MIRDVRFTLSAAQGVLRQSVEYYCRRLLPAIDQAQNDQARSVKLGLISYALHTSLSVTPSPFDPNEFNAILWTTSVGAVQSSPMTRTGRSSDARDKAVKTTQFYVIIPQISSSSVRAT